MNKILIIITFIIIVVGLTLMLTTDKVKNISPQRNPPSTYN